MYLIKAFEGTLRWVIMFSTIGMNSFLSICQNAHRPSTNHFSAHRAYLELNSGHRSGLVFVMFLYMWLSTMSFIYCEKPELGSPTLPFSCRGGKQLVSFNLVSYGGASAIDTNKNGNTNTVEKKSVWCWVGGGGSSRPRWDHCVSSLPSQPHHTWCTLYTIHYIQYTIYIYNIYNIYTIQFIQYSYPHHTQCSWTRCISV